jgi:hypothetical protein
MLAVPPAGIHNNARTVDSTRFSQAGTIYSKPNDRLTIFNTPVLTNKFGLLVQGDVEFGSKSFALLGRPFAKATKTTRVLLALPSFDRDFYF